MGGFIGIVLGIGLTSSISYFTGWPTPVSFYAILIAFIFATGVGIFFGIYPARKASRMNPIDALRYE
jgi:putative ABC transport system permease protein